MRISALQLSLLDAVKRLSKRQGPPLLDTLHIALFGFEPVLDAAGLVVEAYFALSVFHTEIRYARRFMEYVGLPLSPDARGRTDGFFRKSEVPNWRRAVGEVDGLLLDGTPQDLAEMNRRWEGQDEQIIRATVFGVFRSAGTSTGPFRYHWRYKTSRSVRSSTKRSLRTLVTNGLLQFSDARFPWPLGRVRYLWSALRVSGRRSWSGTLRGRSVALTQEGEDALHRKGEENSG